MKKSKFSSKEIQAKPRTRQVHGRFHSKAWDFSHHLIPPMTSSTTFRLGSLKRGAKGFLQFAQEGKDLQNPILIYDRLHEPNTLMLEEQLAAMEEGECALSFSTGMGAISTALMMALEQGDKILCHKTIYGCTYSLLTQWLPKFGITTEFVDLNDPQSWSLFSDSKVRVIFGESISNPNLEVLNLPKISQELKKANAKKRTRPALFFIDNTFATPWSLRPLSWGVDVVLHSLTKNISGFGTEMGGALVTRNEFASALKIARKDFGAILSPKSAWEVFVHGIPTLSIRFDQQQKTAWAIAKYLDSHPKVERVIYPGLPGHPNFKIAKRLLKNPEGDFSPGFMVSFTLKGSMNKTEQFIDDIATGSYAMTLAVSLGTTKTLIEVPGYMTHSTMNEKALMKSGIDPRLIRLSVGLEHLDDLKQDLSRSLGKI